MATSQTTSSRRRNSHARDSLGFTTRDVVALMESVKVGLPFARLVHFARTSGLSLADLSKALDIPPRTLARRKVQGALNSEESERLVRLGRLFDQATELFEGDRAAALAWLRRPAKSLGNRTPLLWAKSEIGARAVEDLIGRLEFGVYS